MKFYNSTKEEVAESLNSDLAKGLDDEGVKASLAKHGLNELKEAEKESLFIKFLKEFKDPLIIILLIAALVSVIVDPHEWIESIIILVVVLINAILGVYQEANAEKALEALKQLSSPNAKVIRNNKKIVIPSKEVCVGDLLVIEAGDYIASDARIIESYQMQVDESALTGESLPVEKTAEVLAGELPLGDQKNMVFASTVCTYGRGVAMVTSVGMENEVGKIADMLQNGDETVTPLQLKLAQISKVIGIMCIAICIVVFGLEMIDGMGILDAFKTAVALAVAAIPEGLATVVTIVLSIGVTKMVAHNSIVRKLPSVETLGSCTVICSDKTGTLTQNKMTVTNIYTPEEKESLFDKNATTKTMELLEYFTLCSDGSIKVNDGKVEAIGDPTETAVVYALSLLNESKEDLDAKHPRIKEFAFDSDRKMMTTITKWGDETLQVTKGAPDIILNRCVGDVKEAVMMNEKMADNALRVLAVAVKKNPDLTSEISEDYEKDLTFVGLIGMIDPPRDEVKDAIAKAKRAGVKTIMITGDHLITAKAIAKDLGILSEGQKAITGEELNQMSDEQLDKEVEDIRVYARVAPEHKVRIVKAFQARGEVVAMTGDGVNDSPALKAADIGCAMGITGTDVSKGAADMILTDDNFATIIEAIRQGRGIYSNIKKDVNFLLSSNIGEVCTIFFASMSGLFGMTLGTPLLPIHLLWINLITDTLPAFALGMEEVDDNVMKEKPRPKNESFFAHGMGFKIALEGLVIGILTLTSYIIGNSDSHDIGMTMAFITLVMIQLFHSFNIKSSHSVFSKQVLNNKFLIFSFILGLALLMLIIYVPFLSELFSLAPLDPYHYAVAMGLALSIVVIMEIVKLIQRLREH